MSKIRIALIESHELTRVGIRVALQQQQRLEVVGEAANANNGLQMLKTTAPDVVILEICLPGKNGIELTKQLKAVQETGERKTKVLILTRQNSKENSPGGFSSRSRFLLLEGYQLQPPVGGFARHS